MVFSVIFIVVLVFLKMFLVFKYPHNVVLKTKKAVLFFLPLTILPLLVGVMHDFTKVEIPVILLMIVAFLFNGIHTVILISDCRSIKKILAKDDNAERLKQTLDPLLMWKD